jgi:sulfur relay (sulfurtransferase) DsrF/TusC family protein
MAKILNIIESAYRATLEEQDDTIVWITHAMKGQGADIDVLLRGNAVNYAVKGQKVEPLKFGAKANKHAPDIEGDVKKLTDKGIKVFLVKEDASERGLEGPDFIDGVEPVSSHDVPKMFGDYDRIWHW